MARHNRDGRGTDQRGFAYTVSYQPDWLRHIKVTRQLPSGRQSTMTLFRNPLGRAAAPTGDRVRTRIASEEQDLEVEVTVRDADGSVKAVTVACNVPAVEGNGQEEVVFTLANDLPAPE